MKKIIIFLTLLLITGCGKLKVEDVIQNIKKQYDKSSGYQLSGHLEITNNEDIYHYIVKVDYKKKDFYKVQLENDANGFRQIILKNQDGVYLLTPSLNKSFKFQSDWPYHNSQAYLLDTILEDIQNDKNVSFEKLDDQYVVSVKANYPNNRKYVTQKVLFDSKYRLKKVSIYDENGTLGMEFTVDKIKYSPKYDASYFDFNTISDDDTSSDEETVETGIIEDIIYPLFLPEGTKLADEEKVHKDNGERVIMTYDGEKSFVLVEETMDVFHELTVIPSSGEPFQLLDTIGVMRENSLSWSSGNIDYYLVSEVMSQEELVEVAQSIVGITSFK